MTATEENSVSAELGSLADDPASPSRAPALGVMQKVIEVAATVIAGAALAACACVVLYSIIHRDLLNGGELWTNEVAAFLLIWVTFIGAVPMTINGLQPRMMFGVARLPDRVRHGADLLAECLSNAVYAFLVEAGIRLLRERVHTVTPGSHLSLAWGMAPIPVGAAAILIWRLCQVRCTGIRGIGTLVIGIGLAALLSSRELYLPESTAAWLLILGFCVLLLLAMPIGDALLFAGILAYSLSFPFSADTSLSGQMFDELNTFQFVAIPLFLLAGVMMTSTSAARRIMDFAKECVGWLPGGLAVADVAAHAVFADMSGSAVADTVALGTATTPEMVRAGYPRPYLAGLQCASGTLGVMFPPSISMLLYASVAQVSVATLFEAILLPAVLVTVSFMVVAILLARRGGFGARLEFDLGRLVRRFGTSSFALGTPVIVLGGIFGGLFTAAEAGAVAALYTALVAVLTRDTSTRNLLGVLNDAVQSAARVLFVIAAALAFGWLIIQVNIAQNLVTELSKHDLGEIKLLIVLMIALVVLHTVLETSVTILVVVPLLLPLLAHAHVDLVLFGVLVGVNSAIGLCMPPLGLSLYLVAPIVGVSIEQAAKAVLPYVAILSVDITILLAAPQITSFLPHLIN